MTDHPLRRRAKRTVTSTETGQFRTAAAPYPESGRVRLSYLFALRKGARAGRRPGPSAPARARSPATSNADQRGLLCYRQSSHAIGSTQTPSARRASGMSSNFACAAPPSSRSADSSTRIGDRGAGGTGGANCCLMFHLFEIGTRLRKISDIDVEFGNQGPHFVHSAPS
jgi:hypothetical protein